MIEEIEATSRRYEMTQEMGGPKYLLHTECRELQRWFERRGYKRVAHDLRGWRERAVSEYLERRAARQ